MENEQWEQQARERVAMTPLLLVHEATIFDDWPHWMVHMKWIATADEDEIINWAKSIEAMDLGNQHTPPV